MQRDRKRCLDRLIYNPFCVKDKTLEIAVRLSPKQLDHAVPVLEELIQEIVKQRQKGTRL